MNAESNDGAAAWRRQLQASLPTSKQDRYVLAGLALTLVGLPLSRALLSLAVVWLGISLLFPGKSARQAPAWVWLGIALLSAYLLGMIHTEDQLWGWRDLWQKLPLLVIPMALFRTSRLPARSIRGLFWLFVASCSLACLVMFGLAIRNSLAEGLNGTLLRECLFGDCPQPDRWEQVSGWFSYVRLSDTIAQHPHFLSLILQVSFVALIWLWVDGLNRGRQLSRWGLSLLAGLHLLSMALLASRMQQIIFLLLLVAVGGYLLKKEITWRQFLPPALVVMLLFGGGQLLLPANRDRVLQVVGMLQPDASMSGRGKAQAEATEAAPPAGQASPNAMAIRLNIWRSAYRLAMAHPWIGVGTGDFREELTRQFSKDDNLYAYRRGMDPHNQFFATWIAIGLPGLLLLLGWFGANAWTALRRGHFPWLLWTVMFALSCLTETMLGRQIGVALWAVVTPLLAFHLPLPGRGPGGETESGPGAGPADTASSG